MQLELLAKPWSKRAAGLGIGEGWQAGCLAMAWEGFGTGQTLGPGQHLCIVAYGSGEGFQSSR